ncbi:multiheme c-type cytochrome [Sulfurimonas paralvinellae]|uniref:Cytochrome c-552/4 domain-containing protein n=1 Tax=Sulfurimonas paralvinellae TaxID=317658 RepID=A0A7M1B8S7_9BACT|nr:multiheme c-type cytochrome [Sulfurimonas paralvinellae]QOP45826.1 hypothetical protein FM071_05795 [Sulfurimonas paralvinellae]
MKKFTLLLSLLLTSVSLWSASQTKVCQKCHPLIYKEYYNSIHRKSSLQNDMIYKAIFEKEHADKQKCANCHSPSATDKLQAKEEPISCIYCHTITDVKENDTSNQNMLSGKKKDFYTAEVSKKNESKVKFETTSSFFGLIKNAKNSPYHQIEYNNENYYNGNVCMGCHSHVNNEHGFDVIMLDAYIDKKDKETCISCHMPKIMGSKTTLRDTKTHAYHGMAGVHNMSKSLGKYIDISAEKNKNGFVIQIKNQANHALFGQAYREGVLQVSISRKGKTITLKPFIFKRTFTKNGKASLPFEATDVLKDTLIYAKKSIEYDTKLQQGDLMTVTLGFRLISEEAAKVLGLKNDKKLTEIKILKTELFQF